MHEIYNNNKDSDDNEKYQNHKSETNSKKVVYKFIGFGSYMHFVYVLLGKSSENNPIKDSTKGAAKRPPEAAQLAQHRH